MQASTRIVKLHKMWKNTNFYTDDGSGDPVSDLQLLYEV